MHHSLSFIVFQHAKAIIVFNLSYLKVISSKTNKFKLKEAPVSAYTPFLRCSVRPGKRSYIRFLSVALYHFIDAFDGETFLRLTKKKKKKLDWKMESCVGLFGSCFDFSIRQFIST